MLREASIVARVDDDFKMPASFGAAKAERDTVTEWYTGALSSKLEAERQKAAAEEAAAAAAAAAAEVAMVEAAVTQVAAAGGSAEEGGDEGRNQRKFDFI